MSFFRDKVGVLKREDGVAEEESFFLFRGFCDCFIVHKVNIPFPFCTETKLSVATYLNHLSSDNKIMSGKIWSNIKVRKFLYFSFITFMKI